MRIDNLEIQTTTKQILDKLLLECKTQKNGLFQKGYKDIGDYFMVQCPYHKFGKENKPSAQFRKSDALFYCFSCKETHSIMAIIEHCLDTNGRKWLLDNFDSSTVEDRNISFNLERKQVKNQKYIDREVLKQYRFIHPYMYERKLDLETIRKFDIGYDKEHNCITFPNKDPNGNILFIATRNINNKFFHYPSDVDKPLYGMYEINREIKHGNDIKEVYICESMLDALVIWRYGKYAIALNGTGSQYQYDLLRKSDFRVLILATDNDEAGKKARERLKKAIKNKIIKEIDYDSYGNCKDINDMTEEQFLNAKII